MKTLNILIIFSVAVFIVSCAQEPEDRTDRIHEMYGEHESSLKEADCGLYCIEGVCIDLGECETWWLCGDDNICYDPCDGKECGESEGINCGDCETGFVCNSSNSCEEFAFPDMILVPSGTTASDNGSITVNHDFYIGKYEVTFAEYEKFASADDEGWGKGNRPVINVSWYDAIKYLNWLSDQAGFEKVYAEICYTDHTSCIMDTSKKGYRLPTEQEWEYVVRGGKDGNPTTYSGSDTIDDVAWYTDNSGSKTHEVGTKNANELGVYDMSGNVWEWNFDRWDATSSDRVFRGGSWLSSANICRSAIRNYITPTYRFYYLGFRVSRTK